MKPHTKAKHFLLQRYLSAWFPILGSGHKRIVYIDGFAGPGRYAQGEEGSPLIAIRAALSHQLRLNNIDVVFVFIEGDPQRAEELRDRQLPSITVPKNFRTVVICGHFEDTLQALQDELDAKQAVMAPTFAFIDPFGIKGAPFHLIERLIRRPRCEAFINFNTEGVQRWVQEVPARVDELVGMRGAADRIGAARDRVAEARRLYSESLKRVATYAPFFQIRSDRGLPIYDLFFATKHPLGFEKMKEAMWAADPTGTFSFSAGTDTMQLELLGPEAISQLPDRIAREFAGRTVVQEEVSLFVSSRFLFLPKHVRSALVGLEENARIEVATKKADGKPRRAGTFPDGTILKFGAPNE